MFYRVQRLDKRKPGFYISLIVEDDFEHRTFKADSWYCHNLAEVEKVLDNTQTDSTSLKELYFSTCGGSGAYSFEAWRIVERTEDGSEYLVEQTTSETVVAMLQEQAQRDGDRMCELIG